MRLFPAAPAEFTNEKAVFGVAHMPEGHRFANIADIYLDRVEPLIWNKLRSAVPAIFGTRMARNNCRAVILGMVLAHEMGHLLLGTQSHSKTGVMRPRWSRLDLENAYFGRQRFTPRQVKRLQANVRARSLKANGS
ncbi:MAG: hypothetical protein GY953_15760 [bacterium]|nr:hypothetical protein [bacterium]